MEIINPSPEGQSQNLKRKNKLLKFFCVLNTLLTTVVFILTMFFIILPCSQDYKSWERGNCNITTIKIITLPPLPFKESLLEGGEIGIKPCSFNTKTEKISLYTDSGTLRHVSCPLLTLGIFGIIYSSAGYITSLVLVVLTIKAKN